MEEIERKFLVSRLPELPDKKVEYERYYLYVAEGIELRIQRKNDAFELERKAVVSKLSRTTKKMAIGRQEFDLLKTLASTAIVRDSYALGDSVSIKIYHDRFEGLVRAEVEFENEAEAAKFIPLPWLGQEITHSPLGRDSSLLNLSSGEFQDMLKE